MLFLLIVLFIMPTCQAAAQGSWSQTTACPGWNNPNNFTAGNSNYYYSGQSGTKNGQAPNVLTGNTGVDWNGSTYTAAQMATAAGTTYSCNAGLPSNDKLFAIMTPLSQATGHPANRDPNTGDTLPFVPDQFNTYDADNPVFTTNLTSSIRIGDGCGGSAAMLRYNMTVTPDNAMLYIYYALVFEAPNHQDGKNPVFIIRVMRQNAANQWVQISDTLAYAVSSTPVSEGGTVVIGQDGWHAYGSGYSAIYFKEWTKTAINLSNLMYENVRIEVIATDCQYSAHYGYAYICGECGPATLSSSGCPTPRDTNVTTLQAPRDMVSYVWYASEQGELPAGAEDNPLYTWRQLTPDDSTATTMQNYNVKVDDFRVVRRADGTAIDSMGSRQTFRCKLVSALDPSKPFNTYFYITVQNNKPVMVVDTVMVNDSTVRFKNHSYVPGNPTLVQLDSTQWYFYDNASGVGTPIAVMVGDSVDYTIAGLPALSVVVRSITNDSSCYSEALYTVARHESSGTACPEVRIAQKYDHTPLHTLQGWDTVVDCINRTLELTCDPFIPVQFFNGTYTVEEIPYNPPDTTFYLGGQGQQVSIMSDDRFAPSVNLAFPFFFFGIEKNQFRIGDNGLITFASNSLFQQDGSGDMCPYQFSAPIPWTPTTTGKPNLFNRTHDAVYGVYEDTYVGPGGSYLSGNQGIYYGVLDEYPCRKIIASWNEIPLYGNSSKRQSYQMVCYEGSNIIEVHIKQRLCCPSTSSAVIGIQNATGMPQVPGNANEPNRYVQSGAPAAFWPIGRNAFTNPIDRVAYRFSPQGTTNYTEQWYRIFDDGRDSVALPNIANNPMAMLDTNGYCFPIEYSTTAPSHARAVVSPTSTSRYVYRLRFQNANGDWYDLADTITIGVDTMNTLTIKDGGANDVSEDSTCFGEVRNYMLTMNAMQDTQQMTWVVTRSNNGSSTPVPLSMLHLDTMRVNGDNRQIPFSINTSEIYGGTAPTSTDTITVTCMVDFTNGCSNYCQLRLAVMQSAIEDTVASVCDSIIWHGITYRSSTVVTYTPTTGCNVIRLTLTVRQSSDTVVVHDVAENNLPYIINSLTLTHDTTFTMHTVNSVDCDSTITVIVIVHFNQDTTVDSTVCEGLLPLLWNDVPFYLAEVDYTTNTITHQTTIPTVHGADSLITMRLHLLYNSTDTISDTIYQNDLPSFTPPLPVSVGYTQNENDPALVTIIDSTIVIPNAVFCDSLVYYTLYLYRNFHTHDTVTVCDNQLPAAYLDTTLSLEPTDTLPLSNTVTREFTFAHQSIHNTDSIITVTLTVHPTYEVSDTVVICSYNPYIYEGVDYGGPADFDTTLNSIHNCDSLVHVSLQARDTLFRLAPLISFDSVVWYPVDTTLIGCDPQNLWLCDTSTSVSREWAVWSAVSAADTTGDTLNIYDTILPIGIYSFRIIAAGAEGCIDTVQRDSAIHIFQRPTSDFSYGPDIVPFHEPQLTLMPEASPADSLTYRWLIATVAPDGSYDTLQHDEQQSDGRWHYSWEPLTDSGHYDVALVAYWKHTITRISGTDTLTLSNYCTDTAHHPVTIVNTYLQFPSLVTPNGDGTNDTWEIVNLVEMGQYPNNEVWIYNQWGALVFHAKNIDSHELCWDPNASNSPDGTYFFRFSGKGRYGVIKQNGAIEVMRGE